MVYFGIDQLLLSNPSWKHQRIALVTNEAATTYNGIASRKALQDIGFNLVKLFSPEHGLSAKGADGEAIHDGIDELTDLPIISLYGTKLTPTATDLSNIDLIIFDIPDVGVRFYTYLWTLTYVMESCAINKKKLVVLDRPNPLSGNIQLAEGPFLDDLSSSFIGRWSIPIRHSCTLGELARYFNATQHLQVDLEIIACSNWKRDFFEPDWKLPFVGTSPALQSFESILLYPALCFLEATNISEGRGTEEAFQIVGAPWLKHTAISLQLNNLLAEEIYSEPIAFLPVEAKFVGEQCNGIRIAVKNYKEFKPVFLGFLLLKLLKEMHPNNFKWNNYKTNVNPQGDKHLDKLIGITNSEALFELPFPTFLKTITKLTSPSNWESTIDNFLLY